MGTSISAYPSSSSSSSSSSSASSVASPLRLERDKPYHIKFSNEHPVDHLLKIAGLGRAYHLKELPNESTIQFSADGIYIWQTFNEKDNTWTTNPDIGRIKVRSVDYNVLTVGCNYNIEVIQSIYQLIVRIPDVRDGCLNLLTSFLNTYKAEFNPMTIILDFDDDGDFVGDYTILQHTCFWNCPKAVSMLLSPQFCYKYGKSLNEDNFKAALKIAQTWNYSEVIEVLTEHERRDPIRKWIFSSLLPENLNLNHENLHELAVKFEDELNRAEKHLKILESNGYDDFDVILRLNKEELKSILQEPIGDILGIANEIKNCAPPYHSINFTTVDEWIDQMSFKRVHKEEYKNQFKKLKLTTLRALKGLTEAELIEYFPKMPTGHRKRILIHQEHFSASPDLVQLESNPITLLEYNYSPPGDMTIYDAVHKCMGDVWSLRTKHNVPIEELARRLVEKKLKTLDNPTGSEAAIVYYTLQDDALEIPKKLCLYKILNETLLDKNLENFSVWKPYIYFLLNGLENCEKYSGVVYRAVDVKLTNFSKLYVKGNIITVIAFTNASKSEHKLKDSFRAKGGTWMKITSKRGRSIKEYSTIVNEDEVVFVPNTRMRVVEVNDPLTRQELNTPDDVEVISFEEVEE